MSDTGDVEDETENVQKGSDSFPALQESSQPAPDLRPVPRKFADAQDPDKRGPGLGLDPRGTEEDRSLEDKMSHYSTLLRIPVPLGTKWCCFFAQGSYAMTYGIIWFQVERIL